MLCEIVTNVAGEINEVGSAVGEFKVGNNVVSTLKILGNFQLQIFSIHSSSKVIYSASFMKDNMQLQKAVGPTEYVAASGSLTVVYVRMAYP